MRVCSCASDAKGSVGLAALPKASCVYDPDWNGHCGVGGSITGPRSVPDQGGEVTQSSSSIAGYRVCASEVCFPLAARIEESFMHILGSVRPNGGVSPDGSVRPDGCISPVSKTLVPAGQSSGNW